MTLGDFWKRSFMDLSMQARTSAKDRETGETELFQQDIAKIGWDLYDQLFPQQLKEEWPKILANRQSRQPEPPAYLR